MLNPQVLQVAKYSVLSYQRFAINIVMRYPRTSLGVISGVGALYMLSGMVMTICHMVYAIYYTLYITRAIACGTISWVETPALKCMQYLGYFTLSTMRYAEVGDFIYRSCSAVYGYTQELGVNMLERLGGKVGIEKRITESKHTIRTSINNALYIYRHSDDFKPHSLIKCDEFDVAESEYESDLCVIERVDNTCDSPESLPPMVIGVDSEPEELDYELLYCEY